MVPTDDSVRSKQADTDSTECSRTLSTFPRLSAFVAASHKSLTPTTVSKESTSGEDSTPSAWQQVKRDSRGFWAVLVFVSLMITTRPLIYLLVRVLLILGIFVLEKLLYLLELVNETTFVVGILLWLVYGGHQWLVVPSWLQPPVQSAQAQLADVLSEKKLAPAAMTSRYHANNAASLVTLSYAPNILLDIAPCNPVEGIAVRFRTSVADVVIDTVPANHAVAAPSDLTDIKSASRERKDRVEHNRAITPYEFRSTVVVEATLGHHSKARATERSTASSASCGQIAVTERMTEDSHEMIRTVKSVGVNMLAATGQQCAYDISTLADLHNVVQVEDSTACGTISDITSGSGGDQITTTSGISGCSSTCPSSEDGSVAINKLLSDDDDSHAATIGLANVKVDLGLGQCLTNHAAVGSVEVARLMEAHNNPTFCEGPLDNARQEALYRRHRNVGDFYNQGETSSDFTGTASWPDRSISGDEEDIYGMIEQVWHYLSSQTQHYIANNGFRELIRTRDGITGFNFFSVQLELAWHRNNPLMMDGRLHPVVDIMDVYIYQMLKTRSHRTPVSTSSVARSGSISGHRQYLTDEQEVHVNQGSIEYIEETANTEVPESVQELRASSKHGEAQLDNPVLGWLDDMEGVEHFDASNYLPCSCGKQAIHDHLQFRYTPEPGYDPSQHACAAPEPGFLLVEALEMDRLRKMLEANYYVPAVGCARSQCIAQICDLHAIPSSNLWILVDDCVEDVNECLVDAPGDLPVPGFVNLQKYPHGFRIPRGFLEVEHDELPPRCKHGYLHPPFADHCNRCFPNGEHKDCSECDAHGVPRAIERNPRMEAGYEVACNYHDQRQLALASKAVVEEKTQALRAQSLAQVSHRFSDWSPAVVV